MKLLTPAEIRQGYAYSTQASADKPLGAIHHQIMLDFMATQVSSQRDPAVQRRIVRRMYDE